MVENARKQRSVPSISGLSHVLFYFFSLLWVCCTQTRTKDSLFLKETPFNWKADYKRRRYCKSKDAKRSNFKLKRRTLDVYWKHKLRTRSCKRIKRQVSRREVTEAILNNFLSKIQLCFFIRVLVTKRWSFQNEMASFAESRQIFW